jgi:hypothetical protein
VAEYKSLVIALFFDVDPQHEGDSEGFSTRFVSGPQHAGVSGFVSSTG